jgi:hypothetical protein
MCKSPLAKGKTASCGRGNLLKKFAFLNKSLKFYFKFSEELIEGEHQKLIFKEELMAVQSLSTSTCSVSALYASYTQKSQSGSEQNSFADSLNADKNTTSSLQFAASYFSTSTTTADYQNSDGDTVTLSSQSMDLQKAFLTAKNSNNPDDWKKIIDYLKNQYAALKSGFTNGRSADSAIAASDTTQAASSSGISGLSDYWNAENTSQRIVDFATSFAGAFKGSKDEFATMIKDAVEKGFSQAKDITGDLPDKVSALVNNTHDLTMKKLDDWINQQSGAATDVSTATSV